MQRAKPLRICTVLSLSVQGFYQLRNRPMGWRQGMGNRVKTAIVYHRNALYAGPSCV